MADDRDRTWRTDQKEAFGRRLTAARKAMRGPDGKQLYKRTADFIKALQKRLPDARAVRAYYNYEAGDRVPREDAIIDLLAEMLNVSRSWLLFGVEEEIIEGPLNGDAATINQATDIVDINPSQFGRVRYIPIFTASDIKRMLLGNGNLTSMTRDRLPVPQHVAAGPRAFGYQIPEHDTSMVGGSGPSFVPRTHLSIDPDRDILPGDFLLAWPADMPEPVMRRLQSAFAFVAGAPRYPFKLVALNPMVEAMTVATREDAVILGRVVAYTHTL